MTNYWYYRYSQRSHDINITVTSSLSSKVAECLPYFHCPLGTFIKSLFPLLIALFQQFAISLSAFFTFDWSHTAAMAELRNCCCILFFLVGNFRNLYKNCEAIEFKCKLLSNVMFYPECSDIKLVLSTKMYISLCIATKQILHNVHHRTYVPFITKSHSIHIETASSITMTKQFCMNRVSYEWILNEPHYFTIQKSHDHVVACSECHYSETKWSPFTYMVNVLAKWTLQISHCLARCHLQNYM